MHALILMTVLAQWAPREAPHYGHTRESRRMGNRSFVGYAFEFAPTSGAGMPSACSTTAPTGAKGEVLTFTRDSNATCSKKGLATTGIADGDLVVMSGNVARVEPDADGVLGLRVEGARTNAILRSQEFDDASWTKVTISIAAPTVTANAAVAPDGATTAERVQIAASTATAQVSVLRQSVTGATGSVRTCSVYIKGNGTSGTTYIYNTKAAGGSTPSTCAYVAGSWSRCSHTFTAGTDDGCDIGTNTYLDIAPTQPAHDVFLWQADFEIGDYATSPIPTVAAEVTRNAEAASFTLPSAIGPSFSLGVSMWWPSSSVGAVTALQLGTGAPDLARIGRNTDTAATLLINATTTTPAVSAMGTTQQRGTLNDSAGARTATWQGASVAAPASSMTGTTTAVSIGALDGIVTKVCADPVAGRCTP